MAYTAVMLIGFFTLGTAVEPVDPLATPVPTEIVAAAIYAAAAGRGEVTREHVTTLLQQLTDPIPQNGDPPDGVLIRVARHQRTLEGNAAMP
jgi:hypothetical protein